MRSFLRVLVVAVAVAVLSPVGALAATHRAPSVSRLPLSQPGTFFADDGSHRIQYVGTSALGVQELFVFDLATQTQAPVSAPAGCSIQAAGPGGTVCSVTGSSPTTFMIAGFQPTTWKALTLPAAVTDGAGSVTVEAVGRHWLRVGVTYSVPDPHVGAGADWYVSVATGNAIAWSTITAGNRWPDLSALLVAQPLCSPLHSDDETVTHPTSLIGYSKPWGLLASSRNKAPYTVTLRLRHCGSPHTTTLCHSTSCARTTAHIGAGLAVWDRGRKAYIRHLATKRTTRVEAKGHTVSLSLVGHSVLAHLDATRGYGGTLALVRNP